MLLQNLCLCALSYMEESDEEASERSELEAAVHSKKKKVKLFAVLCLCLLVVCAFYMHSRKNIKLKPLKQKFFNKATAEHIKHHARRTERQINEAFKGITIPLKTCR